MVIGGTGFLGAIIARELRRTGWEVTALARGHQANPSPDIPLLRADRTQPGALLAATQGHYFSLVIDCAAFQESDAAAAVAAFSGRVDLYVFISTDFVYAARPDARFPLQEDAPKQWNLPYAGGKLACETLLLRAWETQRFPVTILRPPHILGAGRPLGCDPLVMRQPRLLEEIRTGRTLPLLAEGQFLIQPVWNQEVAACIAHLAAATGQDKVFGQVLNCAGPDAITTRHYYEIIAGILGVPLLVRSVALDEFVRQSPDQAHMARHRIYDLSRLRDVTGFTPRGGVDDAIHDTMRWIETMGT